MGDLFHPSRDQLDLTAVMHALSDPARRKVVRTLAAEGERACGSFPLGVTKATASHHFKVLREAGITMTRVEGALATSRCAATTSTRASPACSTLS